MKQHDPWPIRFSPEQAASAKNDRTPEFKMPSVCPKCSEPFPFHIDDFDVIDVLRCPNCDALFERGGFVCYGAKPRANQLK